MRCLNCGKNVDISYGKLECPYCGYILDSEENKLSNFNADIKDNKGKKALKKGVIAAGSAAAGIGSIYALNELAKTTKSVPEKDNFNVNQTLGKDSTINSLKDNITDILNKNINESENNDEIDNVTQNDTLNNENNLNKQDDINIKNVSSKSKKSNNKNNQSNKKDSTNLEKNPNLNNESNEDLDNNKNNSDNLNKDSNTNNENPNSNNSNNESENNEENNNVQNDNELEDSSDENVSSDEQEEGFENLTPQQVSQPSTISSGGGNSSQYYADKYKNATEEMVIDPFCLTHSIAVLGGGRSSYESLATSVINLKNALNNATNVNISFNISGLESKVNESIGSGGTGGKVDEFLGKLRNVRNMEEEKFGGAEEYLKLVKSSEYYLEYLEYDKQQKLNDAFTAIKFENPNSQKYKDAKKYINSVANEIKNTHDSVYDEDGNLDIDKIKAQARSRSISSSGNVQKNIAREYIDLSDEELMILNLDAIINCSDIYSQTNSLNQELSDLDEIINNPNLQSKTGQSVATTTGFDFSFLSSLFSSKNDKSNMSVEEAKSKKELIEKQIESLNRQYADYEELRLSTEAESIFRIPLGARTDEQKDKLIDIRYDIYEIRQSELADNCNRLNNQIEDLTKRKEELELKGASEYVNGYAFVGGAYIPLEATYEVAKQTIGVSCLSEEEKEEYNKILSKLNRLEANKAKLLECNTLYETLQTLSVGQRSDYKELSNLSNIKVEKNTTVVDTFSGSTNTEYIFKDTNTNEVLNLSDEEKALVLAYNNERASLDSSHCNQINRYIDYINKSNGELNEDVLGYLAYDYNKDKINGSKSNLFDSSFDYYFDQGARMIGQEKADRITDYLDTHTADWATLAAIGVGDGISGFFRGIDNALNFANIDDRIDASNYKTMYIADYVANSDDYCDAYATFLNADYEIMNSVGNMLPSMAISLACAPFGGEILGSILLGVSAGGNAMKQALQDGMSREAAFVYGVLSGTSEATLERYLGGIQGLSKMTATAGTHGLTKLVRAGLSEAVEESTQEFLDPFFKLFTTGEWEGVSVENMAKAGLYAFVTAGIMNGGNITVEGVSYHLTDDYNALSTIASIHANQNIPTSQKIQIFLSDLKLLQSYDLSSIEQSLLENQSLKNAFEVSQKLNPNEELTFNDYVSSLTIENVLSSENDAIRDINKEIQKLNKEISERQPGSANDQKSKDIIASKEQEISELERQRDELLPKVEDLTLKSIEGLAKSRIVVGINTLLEQSKNLQRNISELSPESVLEYFKATDYAKTDNAVKLIENLTEEQKTKLSSLSDEVKKLLNIETAEKIEIREDNIIEENRTTETKEPQTVEEYAEAAKELREEAERLKTSTEEDAKVENIYSEKIKELEQKAEEYEQKVKELEEAAKKNQEEQILKEIIEEYRTPKTKEETTTNVASLGIVGGTVGNIVSNTVGEGNRSLRELREERDSIKRDIESHERDLNGYNPDSENAAASRALIEDGKEKLSQIEKEITGLEAEIKAQTEIKGINDFLEKSFRLNGKINSEEAIDELGTKVEEVTETIKENNSKLNKEQKFKLSESLENLITKFDELIGNVVEKIEKIKNQINDVIELLKLDGVIPTKLSSAKVEVDSDIKIPEKIEIREDNIIEENRTTETKEPQTVEEYAEAAKELREEAERLKTSTESSLDSAFRTPRPDEFNSGSSDSQIRSQETSTESSLDSAFHTLRPDELISPTSELQTRSQETSTESSLDSAFRTPRPDEFNSGSSDSQIRSQETSTESSLDSAFRALRPDELTGNRTIEEIQKIVFETNSSEVVKTLSNSELTLYIENLKAYSSSDFELVSKLSNEQIIYILEHTNKFERVRRNIFAIMSNDNKIKLLNDSDIDTLKVIFGKRNSETFEIDNQIVEKFDIKSENLTQDTKLKLKQLGIIDDLKQESQNSALLEKSSVSENSSQLSQEEPSALEILSQLSKEEIVTHMEETKKEISKLDKYVDYLLSDSIVEKHALGGTISGDEITLYKKVEKTTDNLDGIEEVTTVNMDKPFLLGLAPANHYNQSMFGLMRDAARSARIQTSREVAAGYKIDEFPIDIMGLNSTYMSNEEGEAIARDFMYPYLTKNGKNLEDMISQARKMNFLTYCNGTARYLEAEQAVIDLLIKDGFTEQEINSVLSQITVIPFAVESNFDEIKAKTITFIDSNDEEYGKEDKDLLYDVLGDKKHAIIQNGNHITYVYRGNGNHSVQEYLSDDNIVKPALSSVVTTALQNSLNGKETTTTDIIEMVTKYGDETKNIKDLLAEIDKSIGFETAPKYNMMESKIRLELEQAYSKLTNDPFTTTADVREQLLSIKEELKAYSEFVDNIENTPSQQSDGELKLEELDEVRAGIPNIENIRADEAPIKLQEDLAEKITPQNQNIDSHQNEEDYYKQIDDIIKNIDKKFKEYGENIGLSQIKKYLLSGNSAYISGEYRNAITSIPKEVVSKYIEEIDGLRTGVSNQVNVQTLNEDVIMATGTQSVDLSSIQNVIISNINSQISNLEATLNNIRNTLIQDASSLVNNITNRIKYINDLVTQKVKTFTTEQKSSFINKFTTIKQNFIDGANVLKTSMKETYDSIINLFNNLIENIKSKNVVDLDTQKQIYFDQITNAIEYMNVRFIENGKNLGYSQMYEYLQTGNPEYISRAYRDAITSIPREVIYEYFNMTNVNNNQLIMSYPQLRAAQIQQTQSFISSLKNIPSYISSLEEYSNYAYSKYVQFGVEKDFDVLNIREVLTNKYAAYRNVEMKCWGGVNNDVFFNIEIGNETFETPFSNSYKIYVPVEKNSFNSTVEDVFDYLINNNIASNNKIADIPRADGIVLRIYDYNDAMKVIDYINSNPNIPSNVQGIPLAMRYGKVSVAMDGMLSYNSTVIDVLSKYMNVARNPSISGFKNYVSDVLYIINVQRDANLLQNMFLNEWSENRNRFNNVYEYYANKLEVLKLLEYSLDENTKIEDYMKYCESNQNMDNVQKQVEHVYSILNQNERNIPEIQNIEDNNLQNQKIDSHQSEQVYYQQIDSAIKYMDKRFENYGRNKGIEQLKEYVRTGQSKYISREYRDIITAIPKETISKYVKEYDLNQANLVSSSNQQLSTFASLRKNQIQQIQSFINHMNNNRSNFYGNYIRYGVENFDVESIRSYLEQRYASVNNLFIKYWGSGGNYFMNFTIGKETNLTPFRNSYKIYVPVEVNSYNNTVIDVFDYLIKNNIASDNKIARTSRADGIVLRIYDYNDAMKVINYINSDSNIPSNAQGIPLAMRYGKVSLAMDGMLSYNSTVTDVLSYYMNIARNPSIMGFKNYVSDILYKINVERDANLLQNMFLNEWSENRNRFNNIYEYYANKLEVLKLLEYSLDENTRIEDYMKYCESNQNMDNVQKQVEHVYRILNN